MEPPGLPSILIRSKFTSRRPPSPSSMTATFITASTAMLAIFSRCLLMILDESVVRRVQQRLDVSLGEVDPIADGAELRYGHLASLLKAFGDAHRVDATIQQAVRLLEKSPC